MQISTCQPYLVELAKNLKVRISLLVDDIALRKFVSYFVIFGPTSERSSLKSFLLIIVQQLKDVLHRCDRAMIYMFIAGTYFPWLTLEPLPHDGLAAHMRWAVWLLAFLGIIYQQLFHEQYKMLETLAYLVMGCGPRIFFFKCDGRLPFAHAIWHLFVVMAAYSHYYAIRDHLFPLTN
nr:unnamed protein product [Callosobruchus analis]